MSRNDFVDSALYDYILKTSAHEPEVLARLGAETAERFPDKASMQIGPDQAQFMALLARAIGAQKTIEIGVFTGYSSIAVALALPMHGRIIACDVSDEWTSIARKYWIEAGVANKIGLRLAPATETLQHLIKAGEAGTFDFVFIDADKTNYDTYYELCLQLVRRGGLILIDNTLWSGKVADSSVQDDDTKAIRAINEKIGKDDRVEQILVTVGDGLTIAMKR
jgi:predicted O-methyltransferase YrrM